MVTRSIVIGVTYSDYRDPIEFCTTKRLSLNQRRLTPIRTVFPGAPHALRQDPDVVLVGECATWKLLSQPAHRGDGPSDPGNLHTNSAASTINRILSLPFRSAAQVRAQTLSRA